MLTRVSIEKRAVTLLVGLLLAVGGVGTFFTLGWLEDPEFTVKTASVITPYPGATAEEVELEVTDPLEIALQEMPQIDELYSISRAGLSIIRVDIKSEYWADRLPQVWDEMRNKLSDAEPQLPPGVGTPDVGDDFGFVYGFLGAISSNDFSYRDLEDYAKLIRKELSVVPGVARVELWGVQQRVVYVDVSQQQLSQLGLTPANLQSILLQQNLVIDAGGIDGPRQRFRIAPTGTFQRPEDIADLAINAGPISIARSDGGPTGANRTPRLIRLGDFATVTMGYEAPPQTQMRHDGRPAIAFAIAGAAGTNIVEVGERIDARLAELMTALPVGVEVDRISWQSDVVEKSIIDFMINLASAVAIVLAVLTLAMGPRMGLVIGGSLIFTILGTIAVMGVIGVDLHRMSLGALVIAMGMMVDNAIVVSDNYMVRLGRGMKRKEAALDAASQPAFPLLAATVIAVMAFYPIFASTDDAGEYCKELFTVVGISLLFSWIVAMTLTPVMCIDLIKPPKGGEAAGGGFFNAFRGILRGALGVRWIFVGVLVALLAGAMQLFGGLPQQFFPDSARPQFLVDYWAPEGTRIQTVAADLEAIEEKLLANPGVSSVSTFMGSGPPRFYLPVDSEFPYQTYANVVVNTVDPAAVSTVIDEVEPWLDANAPQALTRVRLYGLGPSDTWKFEARFSGPQEADMELLRRLGDEGKAILAGSPYAKEIRTDMRNRVRRLEIGYNDARARWAYIDRKTLGDATRRAYDGQTAGLYREGDTLIPIKVRLTEGERENISSFDSLQVASDIDVSSVPLSQIADDVAFEWEDPVVIRYQRRRAVTVQASPRNATAPTLRADVLAAFQDVELPPGYELLWDGEYKSTVEAQASLLPGLVPLVGIVLFLLVWLYNGFRKPAIILLAIPFIFIGIAPALFATQVPFGFVALLGTMSLAGMMMKNSIVLVDEIGAQTEAGLTPYDAIVEAAASRLRPVVLAAATTVLGVIPLLGDVFWVGMAITIMAGLSAGTVLTMLLVPTLYAMFFRVRRPEHDAPGRSQAVLA